MTNSFFGDNVKNMMFAAKFLNNLKKEKRRVRRSDIVNEQVKQVLMTADQKIILMIRG